MDVESLPLEQGGRGRTLSSCDNKIIPGRRRDAAGRVGTTMKQRPWATLLALVLGLALVAGEALNQTKLDDNEQAQAEGREEEEAVVSHVVEAADEVELQR